jgi:glyoxalase family protein
MRRGTPGNRETRAIAYNIPAGSLSFWQEHLSKAGVEVGPVEQRFGQAVLPFQDPDGMQLELVEVSSPPSVQHWAEGPIPEPYALRGFHSVTLWLDDVTPTAELLTQQMGYQAAGHAENRQRFTGDTTTLGHIVDIIHRPGQPEADFGAGSIHHIAFRVPDDQTQVEYQSALGAAGFRVTEVMDRNYFYSIYFREHGGVLFELATNPPGFLIDEPQNSLGEHLKLPEWFEPRRAQIESSLAPIELKPVQKADVA